MKIVHVLGYYGNYTGGIQAYVKELAKRQTRSGHSVKIITSDLFGTEKSIDGIAIIRCKTLFSFSRVPFCPWLFFSLLKEKCDVIHAHLPLPSWDLAVSIKKFFHPETKLIVTIHNYSLRENRVQKMLSIINDHVLMQFPLFFSDKIITTTKAFGRSLHYKIPRKKNVIIPLGVNLTIFKNADLERNKSLILFVGRLIPEKGLHLLVQAVKELRKQNKIYQILAICAETYDFKKYENMVKKDSQKFLTILKNLPQTVLYKYYSKAGFLAFPSSADSFGFVLIEAMACGCPVIVSNLPGPASIVRQDCGIVFNKNDIKSLTLAILKMSQYQTLFRKNCRGYVEDVFSWRIINEKILELYKTN